jgi:hypothetical protein
MISNVCKTKTKQEAMKDHASNFTPFQIASQWHVLKWQEWKIQQGEDQLIHKFKAEMCSTTNS